MTVLGVIAARGGSKGLPGKNLRLLGGVPMIAWTIRAAKRAKTLTACWVSTDDDAIADVARAHGGEVPFLRPTELATDESSIVDTVRHAVRHFEAARGARPEVVVLLQATTPLRGHEPIDAAVRAIVEEGADSSQTVALDEAHPLLKFWLKDGRLSSVFPNETSSRRQDSPAVYRPNGGVYASRVGLVMDDGVLRGKDHRGVVMDFESSVDIDTLWDFRLAEAIVAETGRLP